jgi:hypothetical protein
MVHYTQTLTKRKQTAKKALKTAKNKRFLSYVDPAPPNDQNEQRPQPHFDIFHIFFCCSVSVVR